MREPLDGFEQEALETEAGLALVVFPPEEGNKFGLLVDGLLQNVHCFGQTRTSVEDTYTEEYNLQTNEYT